MTHHVGLAADAALSDLFGAAETAAFENLTALTAETFDSPISLFSLVDLPGGRQMYRSAEGLPGAGAEATPLAGSFCEHVVRNDAPLVIEDAPQHPLYATNPAAQSLGVGAYLGAPVRDDAGRPFAVICALGKTPRRWSAGEIERMERLAACVADTIRARGALQMAEAARDSALKAQELQEFTYAVSHDLKTPTNTLKMILDEIAAQTHEGEDAEIDMAALLAAGRNTAGRMSRLIDDVLGYAALLDGAPEMALTDLSAPVAVARDDLEAQRRAARGRIDIGALPMVVGCPEHLSALFQNLISNGLKFHRADHPPVVTVSADPPDDAGRVRIRVRDNGIGIAAADRDRAQRIFEQLNARRAYPGSGVGLALCRRIAEMHGTTLDIADAPEAGTEISLCLPSRP